METKLTHSVASSPSQGRGVSSTEHSPGAHPLSFFRSIRHTSPIVAIDPFPRYSRVISITVFLISQAVFLVCRHWMIVYVDFQSARSLCLCTYSLYHSLTPSPEREWHVIMVGTGTCGDFFVVVANLNQTAT